MARYGLVAVGVLGAALTGCGSPRPLSLGLSNGEPVEGTAPAMAYMSTLGGEQKQQCRASYMGNSASSSVLLEIRCADGRYGIGTGELRNSRLVGGIVRMQEDGREARVTVDGG